MLNNGYCDACMHACMHACWRTGAQTCRRTCIQTHRRTDTQPCKRTDEQTKTRTDIKAHKPNMQACRLTNKQIFGRTAWQTGGRTYDMTCPCWDACSGFRPKKSRRWKKSTIKALELSKPTLNTSADAILRRWPRTRMQHKFEFWKGTKRVPRKGVWTPARQWQRTTAPASSTRQKRGVRSTQRLKQGRNVDDSEK